MWRTILVLLMIFILSGCWATREPEPHTFEPVSESDELKTRDTSAHRYYDFEDIPIPREMSIARDGSILFESQGIKAGMLTYTGRVDSESLFNYFLTALPNEGWELLSYIKYGTQIQTFAKDDRLCIIRIIDGRIRTELQIWISPKI
ncbi:hypothetical protein [Desulfonatronospira sp.]|uniref:hypothetical protein n=1 Tax=Desulfonatronospira sp. TaxID=1962951 RepID=UPI0025B99C3B|nr:hypothetical protein [Desulfonatronospira sp.]